MKITTKTGDQGLTDLSGRRVSKASDIMDLMGALDEVSADCICLASTYPQYRADMEQIVSDLSHCCAVIGGYTPALDSQSTERLQNRITELTEGKEFRFHYPFDDPCAAMFNKIRTVVRRAERCYWKVDSKIDRETGHYLNRLSDYFFACQISCSTINKEEE